MRVLLLRFAHPRRKTMGRPASRPPRTARSSSPPAQRRRKHQLQECARPHLSSEESLRRGRRPHEAVMAPARSILGPRAACKWEMPGMSPRTRCLHPSCCCDSDRRDRHVKFCTDENTSRKSSRECVDSVRWHVDAPCFPKTDAVRGGSPRFSARCKYTERDAESPTPEAQAEWKLEATANTVVKTSMADTIPEEELEERTEKKENEERKRRLKVRMKSKSKARMDDEECNDESVKAKPRVAVKLHDGRESWPLEISKWYLSDHGQLLLSCLLPTQTDCTEAQSHQQPSETVISKTVQNDSHCEGKRKHENEDLVTLFERSAISRSVFQTQPFYTPRHTNSETHIRSPINTPTITLTPVVTPPSPPLTPTAPEKCTTPFATSQFLNASLMPAIREVIPAIQMQSFATMMTSQKAMFTHTTPTKCAVQTASSTSGGDNSYNALTKHDMIPLMVPVRVLQSTLFEDDATTSPKIDPAAISNSLPSGSAVSTVTETSTSPKVVPIATPARSQMTQIMPTSVIVKPIVDRAPGTTSMRSSTASEINTSPSPLVKKTSPVSKGVSNVKTYQLADGKQSLTTRCQKAMEQPNMISTMSSAVQCFSSGPSRQTNPDASPALTMTPVPPPVPTPVAAMWAPSTLVPTGTPSLAAARTTCCASTTTQTPASLAPQMLPIEPAKLDEDPPCLTPLTCGPSNSSKGTVTIGAANAMEDSVSAYGINSYLDGNNTFNHSSLQASENVHGKHPFTLLQKNTQSIKSRLETTQQMLRRLTIDIQAQHARICNNNHESQTSTQNSVQPDGSDLPDELQESNTQLGSVSLIIRRNQGSSEPSTKSLNTYQSPEISLQNNSEPDSTITWRFWHPQSASWFTLSLPDKDAHQMLQSAEPVKRNLENLLQSALNVRNPSVDSDPELAENGLFPVSVNSSTDIPNEQQQNDNEELNNKPAPNVQWRLVEPQNGAQILLCDTHATTLSSEETQRTIVQCVGPTDDPQMQSSSEGNAPLQSSPVHESQSCSTLSVGNTPVDECPQIKIEKGASLGDDVVLNQLPSPVVWRLWDPISGSWVNLNISKANPEQVNEFSESHTQDTNKEKETGESTEGPNANRANSLHNEDNDIKKHENILPKTQTQNPEASSRDEPLSKTEKQTATPGSETETVLDDFNTINRNFVKNSLTVDVETEKESSTITNDFWTDNATSFVESDADTPWLTSSLESVNLTRYIRGASSHRYKKSGSGTRRNQREHSGKRYALRHQQSGTRTFLRSQLSVRRWLQRRQKPCTNGRSDHRLQLDRRRRQRSLVNTDYNWQGQHARRCSRDRPETVLIQPADDANVRSVETPSLLLLCLTADTSLLPKARYQRSRKKTYCIIQSATTRKFGNPEQLPWKRASRQWRRNLTNDK